MNVAIVGAGVIGAKRAASLKESDNLLIICDSDKNKAKKLANLYSADFTNNLNDVLVRDIDVAIVSVINKYSIDISIKLIESNMHILCEKPLGRNFEESNKILKIAKNNNKIIKTGFNHRFHPALIKSKKLIDEGAIGKIINIRSRYGHGGRPGMENEWRCSKDLCGGGELIDQGVHIIDLCRWLTSMEVDKVYGDVFSSFWKIKVEDNAFFNLSFGKKVLAQCHVSWTNWKNIFSLEIFGVDGYIKIEGLGGSYGAETLEVGFRQKSGGVPKIESFIFEENDNSWTLEWEDLIKSINSDIEPNGNGYDRYIANLIIDAIYKSSKYKKVVIIN